MMAESRMDIISPTVCFKSVETLPSILLALLTNTQHNPSYILDIQVFNQFVKNLIHKSYGELNWTTLMKLNITFAWHLSCMYILTLFKMTLSHPEEVGRCYKHQGLHFSKRKIHSWDKIIYCNIHSESLAKSETESRTI